MGSGNNFGTFFPFPPPLRFSHYSKGRAKTYFERPLAKMPTLGEVFWAIFLHILLYFAFALLSFTLFFVSISNNTCVCPPEKHRLFSLEIKNISKFQKLTQNMVVNLLPNQQQKSVLTAVIESLLKMHIDDPNFGHNLYDHEGLINIFFTKYIFLRCT